MRRGVPDVCLLCRWCAVALHFTAVHFGVAQGRLCSGGEARAPPRESYVSGRGGRPPRFVLPRDAGRLRGPASPWLVLCDAAEGRRAAGCEEEVVAGHRGVSPQLGE